MKKLFALILTAVISFSLIACGGDSTEGADDAPNQPASETTQQSSSSETAQPVISNEELMGTYVSSYNEKSAFVFKEDGIYWENTGNAFWETYGWRIEGNMLIVPESNGMGNANFEIVKDGDTIQLKFVEMTEGDGGILNARPEFLSVLTKVTAE